MPRLILTDEHWSKLNPIMLENGIYDKRRPRLGTLQVPPPRGKCLCEVKIVSCDSDEIRQIQEKLQGNARIGLRVNMVASMKCKQALRVKGIFALKIFRLRPNR